MADEYFGKQTIGGSGSNAYGYVVATKATPANSGTLHTITGYYAYGGSPFNCYLGIYSDSAGSPGTKLADDELTVTSAGWHSITGLNVSITGSTLYWLAHQHAPNAIVIKYDAGVANDTKRHSQAYGSLPATFTVADTQARLYSIYGTYTPSGGGISVPVAMRHFRNLRTAISKVEFLKPDILRI